MCSTDNKTTKPEQKVFYGSGSRKKIGQTYFKLCQTYFKIGQTYFSALLTGGTASKASGFLRSYAALKHTLVCCGCMALLVGASAMLALASCSDSEHTESAPRENVKLLVSIPGYTATGGKEDKSTGDPGTAVDKGSDWDRLTIILAYNDNGNRVLKRTLSKDDFDNLPDYESRPGIKIKLFTINVPVGNTYIYGITYSSNAANNPEADIDACKSYNDVQELTISNDYASNNSTIDYAKFVSVATGYYAGDDGLPALFTVQQGSGEIGSMPTMTLTRLASKIDVQWDAADAYEQGYTEVKITDFKYNGQAVGRMFPSITPAGTAGTEKEWTFYNTSGISQRNGRVYHYTFTDGKARPHITFNINAKHNGSDTNKDFTLTFSEPLHQAAWYKINATIKGITGSGSINLAM